MRILGGCATCGYASATVLADQYDHHRWLNVHADESHDGRTSFVALRWQLPDEHDTIPAPRLRRMWDEATVELLEFMVGGMPNDGTD